MKDPTPFLENLRDAAAGIGLDYVWPAEPAGEVIRALTDAGCAIMRVQARRPDQEAALAGVVKGTTWDEVDHAGIGWGAEETEVR